jgi:hypothetical protein
VGAEAFHHDLSAAGIHFLEAGYLPLDYSASGIMDLAASPADKLKHE